VLDASPYQEWGTWPTDEWNDFTQFLKSGEPHGNVVRIFVNDVALEAAAAEDFGGILPAGSIVLKENYMGADPEDPGELAALTIMYKVEGFNPEANDWFWVEAAGDGSAIDLEGAVAGCIGCHSQPNNADYLLRYAFGEEPAVPGLGAESGDTEAGAEIRPAEELYQAMGCAGCHNVSAPQTDDSKGEIAPNQGNLFETAGSRVPGQDAETYVYNSIADPTAFVVEGYNPIMPTDFADRMSEAEIRALVAWLLDPNR
jgi:hypothetical protein